MSSNTKYLITGGNRGIGRGFVEALLARNNSTVIAAVRDSSHSTSKSLAELPKGTGSSLIVVKVDSASQTDPAEAIKELQTKHGISVLDVVIANAGISKLYPTVATAKAEDMTEHYNVNVLGPVLLFQAALPLLNKSTNAKFVAISSSAGSIGGIETRPVPNAVYGSSKSVLNYLVRKIHFEHDNIIAIPVDPGWVQTDMGNSAAVTFGVESGLAETTLNDSISGMLKIIDGAKKDKQSGRFLLFDGSENPW